MFKWKTISETKLSDTLHIKEYEYHGFWLWDETRKMYLSVRTKTRDEAFAEALGYYQRRLKEVEEAYSTLKVQVDSFVTSVAPSDSGED